MAQATPNVILDGRFVASSAYYEYLNALGDEWDEAKSLRASLKRANDRLERLRAPWERRQKNLTNTSFVAVVDIRSGNGRNEIAIRAQLGKSQIQGERKGTINLGAANDFLISLRTCTTDIHTRIIILQDSITPKSEDDRALEALLNGQILGVELDLASAYVCHLS